MTRFREVKDQVYTLTRELNDPGAICGALKVAEFYADEECTNFLGLRLVTIRPPVGDWLPFFSPLNNGKEVRAIMRKGIFTPDEMLDVLCHQYFDRYEMIMMPIWDVFENRKILARRDMIPDRLIAAPMRHVY